MTKDKLVRKGLISAYMCQSQSTMKEVRNSNRNLETEIDSEATKEYCLLDSASWLVLLAFLYNPGPPAKE